METELGRLSTYNEWPDESSMFPSKLAEAGFCHTGKVDEVECRVCCLKIREWHKEDDPLARHLTESLDCELARSIKQNIDVPSLLQVSINCQPTVAHVTTIICTRTYSYSIMAEKHTYEQIANTFFSLRL